MPTPTEGVLAVVLVNTAISVAILKELLRSILQVVGIRYPDGAGDDWEPTNRRHQHPDSPLAEEFRFRCPAGRFSSFLRRPAEQDCAVCLTRFDPDSEANRLPCGHFFHKACLEKWLCHWNVTCPLCRAHVLPDDDIGATSAAAGDGECTWF